MAHPTAISATAKSDWYTFLRSAFIDGLKAYGAALMVAAPEPASSHAGNRETSTFNVGAPEPALSLPKGPSHLGTWEINSVGLKPGVRKSLIAAPQHSAALPHSPIAKPAWSRA